MGCLIALLVREPDVARSSGRVDDVMVQAPAMPVRSALALGMVDLAILMVRTTAILMLLSPIILLLLAFT